MFTCFVLVICCWKHRLMTCWFLFRWTYQRVVAPTAKNARPTRSTKWRSTRNPRSVVLPRVVVVTTENKRVMVVKPNLFSGRRYKIDQLCHSCHVIMFVMFDLRRPRPPKRLCWGWSAQNAKSASRSPSSVASTLNLEVTRRGRDRWFSSRLYVITLCWPIQHLWRL